MFVCFQRWSDWRTKYCTAQRTMTSSRNPTSEGTERTTLASRFSGRISNRPVGTISAVGVGGAWTTCNWPHCRCKNTDAFRFGWRVRIVKRRCARKWNLWWVHIWRTLWYTNAIPTLKLSIFSQAQKPHIRKRWLLCCIQPFISKCCKTVVHHCRACGIQLGASGWFWNVDWSILRGSFFLETGVIEHFAILGFNRQNYMIIWFTNQKHDSIVQ